MAESGTFTAAEPGLLSTRPSGKLLTFGAWGEFGGATLRLQVGFVAPDNKIEWLDVGPEAAFDQAGFTNVVVKGNYFRVTASGAGKDTKINWWIG